jgi:uncharacterized protein DUF5990
MKTKRQNSEITIEVVCRNLPGTCFEDAPGRGPVHLGIQKGDEVIEAVPADRKQVVFRPSFRIGKQPDGSPNFLGDFAKGTAQERFFYLSWGVVDKQGHFEMFRRAKIHLNHLTWDQIQSAISSNKPLKVVIDMTGQKGDPICGSIRRRPPAMEGVRPKDRDRADWQF